MEWKNAEEALDAIADKLVRLRFDVRPVEGGEDRLLAFRPGGLKLYSRSFYHAVVVSCVRRLDAAAIAAARARARDRLDARAEEGGTEFVGISHRAAAHVFLCEEVDPDTAQHLSRPWPSLGSWRWLPAAFDLTTRRVHTLERVPIGGGGDQWYLVDLVRRLRDPDATSDGWPRPSPFVLWTFAALLLGAVLLSVLLWSR
jgi:hypothetical protein